MPPLGVSSPIAQDIALPADATDTITSLRWSPVSDHLAVASWDGKVRVYEVAKDGRARGVATLTADGPVFSCDWNKDGSIIAAAGADKKIHVLHAASGQTVAFAAHDAPIRAVRFVDIPAAAGAPILASGSWDSSVRYWDLRQTAAPLATLRLPERVYSLDAARHLLVVATADRNLHLVDLRSDPTAIASSRESQLRFQTKAVAVDPDGAHWSTASIEGRCSSAAADANNVDYNFTWRCHRGATNPQKVTKVYAVNDLSYHPINRSVLATAGSDGTLQVWDLCARHRLRISASASAPLTACAFSRRDGSLMAYAVGYDWSFGYAHNSAQNPPKVMLHLVAKEEATPKKPRKN